MTWSLNEIEAETKKAVRGAGLPWGIAEEGAKAVRWLARVGVDALPALADLLDRHAAGAIAAHLAGTDGLHWRATNPLCPLLLGAAIVDHAHLLADGATLAASPVAHPLLLAPFAARAAQLIGSPVALTVESRLVVASQAGSLHGLPAVLDITSADGIKCAVSAGFSDSSLEHHPTTLATIDAGAQERIRAYAFRTYVPASEQSRLHGAGAGAIDND